ncbi:two-component system sensor histidine kinase KdbD [Mangrovibacter phragmitis]|uniref:histidine kinase n=1 Tax=Mangrovibacter phragmitis TaxID=1691903 RepID=A0A1B7L1H0_9ENTR|nr:two-component system sensor histidine kinase KdpD [Mangrovibacter phragmitis]OAT76239.1 two-component system sensor histidine kinase KdbD [Mangrovibacter phragmitis]
MHQEPLRPDPDRLIAQVNLPERGKLRIFFGACAGVGKTWAMLQEARRLYEQGLDVVVGVVETHGREETARLTEGLVFLPPRRHGHRGRVLEEFDLDGALARHPALVLVDELAHSNAPGSRHPRRWQDVEELLDAGIDVFTTLNVQHLESLNDIVGAVTGVQVRETVPDPIFDNASDVVLVDLPAEDLRQRLREGKVYIPGQAERAIEHFFRTGNLIALRELALRRTADRVDGQMQDWRGIQQPGKVWHTRDAILLCIGARSGNEKLVRTAARMAARMGCSWHAVYVETPRLHRLNESRRRAILSALSLAQELGATTATLSAPQEINAIVRYAREHNLGKVITGRRQGKRYWPARSFADKLAQHGPDLDLIVVAMDDRPDPTGNMPDTRRFFEKWRVQLLGCAVAALFCFVITLFASLWLLGLDTANMVMIYLFGVVVVALLYGRGPSVFATVINVACFDLFFIEPRGTFAVSDVQYLLTFAVMMAVGLLIGTLTAGARYQARVARHREQRTHHLYEISRALAVTRNTQEIALTSQQFIRQSFQADAQLLLPDNQGQLRPVSDQGTPVWWDDAIARWSFDNGHPAGAGTDTLPGVLWQIHPLRTQGKTLGLMVIMPDNLRQLMIPEQKRLLETALLLVTSALDHLNLMVSEEQARVAGERERIRNTLLAALSHDLRTPLTVLFGQAEILTLDLASEGSQHAPQANEIRQQVLNTTRLVNNLLDMARIQSGGFNLHRAWIPVEELIGGALQQLDPITGGREIHLNLPDPLLLIHVDGTLFERVLINLLENAVKYAGNQAQVGITVRSDESIIDLEVWDTGPGIPPGQETTIFEKFARGTKESAIPGVGLGLAICQAIVDVHDGEIYAENRTEGGASFHIRLPHLTPPGLDETDEVM